MKPEKSVCKWSAAHGLKVLGIAQKGNFFFIELRGEQCLDFGQDVEGWKNGTQTFTSSELGVMLGVDVKGVLPEEFNTDEVNKWFEENEAKFDTEANLRAAFLNFAIRSKLISVETCNERLTQ